MQTYVVERANGTRYTISMNPGQLLSLRPDESLLVPEPPKLDQPVAITVLNDHERRIKRLEEQVAVLSKHYPNNLHMPEPDTEGKAIYGGTPFG